MADVSILIPAMNEEDSLRQTINILVEENKDDILEIVVALSPKSTPACRLVAEEMRGCFPQVVKIMEQRLPFLGGALQDGFQVVAGTYVVMMASDMETDPHTVQQLIKTMRADTSYDIIATTRWTGAGFTGYHPVKKVCNFLFQYFFALLYGTSLTDLTFGFRLYKTSVLKQCQWEELKHPFLFECLLKPLRLGARAREVPSSWKAREQGLSQNSWQTMFSYFKTGLRVRFQPKRTFLK